MARVRDDLEAASEDLKQAVGSASDEVKSEVQSASSRLAALVDDARVDVDYYRGELVRAAASVLGPLGWDADDVERWLSGAEPTTLSAFDGRT